ncbi:MAG TPA: hypothetical protein VGM17_15405 [Rhizomicrobium sp.]|jgi:hypothetical protein
MGFRAVLLAMSFAFALAAAAPQLHWPLPDDSTARNGEPQQITKHTKLPSQVHHFAALPKATLHPMAKLGLKRRYSGTPIDVLRYHYDNYPTGWDQSETDLTPASVKSGSFGLLNTLNVDGNVIAQPLLVSSYQMPDGSLHNVLIVATGHDTVYAFDAQDYSLLWQVSMGTAQSSDDVGCGDVVPEYGISSTPVIVRKGASATIYLVAGTEPAPYSFHTKLHALDVGTGKDVMKPVEIDPRAKLETGGTIHLDPQNQWSRSSLAYNNGSLYVSIGSHCDNNAGSISGWELRYDTSTLKLTAKFNTIEASAGYELSSIWMAGYSPAIDASGNVYAITGNGNYNLGRGAKGYGESVISLPPDLNKKQVANFTPSNYGSLNNGDTDFGSGGAMLIPTVPGQAAPPMLVGMGKASVLYLLDATHLGGLESASNEPLQKLNVGGGCWCGPAYYGGGRHGVVYYQSGGDVLRAFSVDAGARPKLKQIASGTSGAGYGGSFPIVSSNGGKANSALVWLIRRDTTETLEAYDAGSLGDPIFQANAGSWNTSGPFLTPLVANGRVYVPAYQTVTVFGLTN